MAEELAFRSNAARLAAARRSLERPDLLRAQQALAANRLREVEGTLRRHLAAEPEDPAALLLLAAVPAKLGLLPEAERLVRRAMAQVPDFPEAEAVLATILLQQSRIGEALELLDGILERHPDDFTAATRKALILVQLGRYEEARSLYEALLADHPGEAPLWLACAQVLRTLGRREEGVAAVRRALAIAPSFGEAWWTLAAFAGLGRSEIEAAESWLRQPALPTESRLHLHFALGRAFEAAGDDAGAFRHYEEGNRLRRSGFTSDWQRVHSEAESAERLYTPGFFEAREGGGCPDRSPIFIVGMPRSGSTLVEQILASHPAVEGISELPYIGALAQGLAAQARKAGGPGYPDLVAALPPERLVELGEAYLAQAKLHRRTDRPFFIDKMPANWLHAGLIHLILPRAKIIDARRDPLDCGFANFRHHFARGHEFAYSLEDLGRYYRAYDRLMAGLGEALPGRIHRLDHEALVAAPEAEIRRLLDHLGLPFDPACLAFHENDRAVATPSADQVRRPISGDAIGRWRRFEPWLGPLKAALGRPESKR